MAITTDSMNVVSSGGINYDFYGLSKTLNNYTFDEIWDYVFCSSSSNSIYHIGYGGTDVSYYTYQGNDNFVPFELRYVATNHNNVYYHAEQAMNNPDGLYMRVIWLQRIANGSDTYIDSNNANQYKLITEFDAKHYVYELITPAKVNNDYGATSWAEGSYLYYSSGGNLYYYDDLTVETPVRINIPRAIPVIIFKDKDNKGYIIPYRQQINRFETKHNTEVSGWSPQSAVVFKAYGSSTYIAFPVVASQLYTYLNASTGELTSPNADGFRLPEGSGIYSQNRYGLSPKENLISIYACGGNTYTLGFQQMTYFRTSNECKKFYSLMGLHYKADKIYKQIIEDGYVTGFTDELSTTSDLDNWDGKTKHNVPPSPPSPSPTPSDDDYESMTTGFASTLSGCTKYYLMSPLDIVTLIRDYYTHAFAGSTLSNSIISCYLCGLSPVEFISTETPAPIKIPTVAGEQIFESVNSYKAIDAVVNKIAVGSIAVPRMNNDFHDFNPYTIYEVFIPYCGWISLPDTVAGKHIYVEFHVDVRTMAGKAIVLIGADDGGKATCAEMSMNFGASTPFAVIEAGLERQAAVTAGIQTAIGTAAAITGINSGHNALTVSSIGTAAQGIANGMMSSMANYTQVQGKAGDTSDFANGRQCYLKISWAKTDEVVNNSRFGHSVGYLCNTVGKIKDFKGLTVCTNPHVNGIDCTESEKEEIKRLLEEGIIVN